MRGLFLFCCGFRFFFRRFCSTALLVNPRLRDSDGERPYAGNDADTFRDGNRSTGVKDIEQVRALQAQLVGAEKREALLLAKDIP